MLYFAPQDWRLLGPALRRKLARRVNLLILGPDPATPADLADARAGLCLVNTLSISEAISTFVELHTRLAQGWTLNQCVEHSQGHLTLVGAEACWPDSNPVPNVTEPPSEPRPQPSSSPASAPGGIAIGQINAEGDVVYGGKTAYQAGGDQVNITHFNDAPAQMTQLAGRDQVNVNRQSPSVTPGTKILSARVCPNCKKENEPTHDFCDQCGGPLNPLL